MLGRLIEKRGFGLGFDVQDPHRIPSNSESGRTYAGPLVTEDTALSLVAVYACVSLIVDAYSQLPGRVHRKYIDEQGRDRRGRVEQPLFVTNPNPSQGTAREHKAMRMASLLLRGNAFSVASRVRRGVPTVVSTYSPDKVKEVYRDDSGRRRYRFEGDGPDLYNWTEVLPADRERMPTVVHQRAFVRPGHELGLSPLSAGRQAIALGMAVEEFGARFFGDGTTPAGVLQTEEDLEPAEALAIQRDWEQAHGNRQRKPAVLSGGLKWEQISVAPEEAQFIETRKLQSLDIAKLYRVAPHMVGDVDRSTSWGSGLEEQGLGFVVYTLGSWISREEQDFYNIILGRGQEYKTNVAALMRGRTSERYAAYAVARSWGWLSVNDIRALEDLEPLDGDEGDVYLQPLNYADAQSALDVLLKNNGTGSGGGPSSE